MEEACATFVGNISDELKMKKTERQAAAAKAGRQVALLRGINVGTAKRVAMATLRDVFAELGYSEVCTLLNSGNVVFTSTRGSPASAETKIEKAILATFGFSARVTVLSAAELAEIISGNPLGRIAKDPSRYLVTVLKRPGDRARLVALTQQDWNPELLALGTRAAYLWCPEGMLVGRLAEAVNRVLGDGATTRNWATMTKLHRKVTE